MNPMNVESLYEGMCFIMVRQRVTFPEAHETGNLVHRGGWTEVRWQV